MGSWSDSLVRKGLFRDWGVSFKERSREVGSLWSVCVFLEGFEECGWVGVLERFLVDLRGNHVYFLQSLASVRSSGLDLLVVIWLYRWLRVCESLGG